MVQCYQPSGGYFGAVAGTPGVMVPSSGLPARLARRVVRPFAHRISPDALTRIRVVGPVEVAAPGCPSPIVMENDGTDRVASLLFWRGIDGWEPATITVFLDLIQRGSVVVDVGANSGLFSLLAGRRHPTARVHALEPVERVFTRLESNVARNRLENVSCHRVALGDRAGTVPLYVPTGEPVPVMASLVAGWTPEAERQEVECLTLDQFVGSLDPGRVDVVKIDAEGSEDAVLRGGPRTLAEHRPFLICEVLARGGLGEAVAAALDGHGYRFFALGPAGLRPVATIAGGIDDDETHNYLFAPEDRLAELRR